MIHGSMGHDFNGRKIKKKAAKGETYERYAAPEFQKLKEGEGGFRRGTEVQYASAGVGVGNCSCSAPEKKVYTGSLVKGIGQMHKSNAIPIIDEEHMKDLARMRR